MSQLNFLNVASLQLSLKKLYLAMNRLGIFTARDGDEQAIIRNTGLAALGNLQELNLNFNHLRMAHLSFLQFLPYLTKLYLNHNRLGVFEPEADQMDIISKLRLEKLVHLQDLELSGNQLSMLQLSFLPLQCLPKLTKLYLNHNRLGVFAPEADQANIIHHTGLAALANLQELYLGYSQLTPSQLSFLNSPLLRQNLKVLDLSAMAIEETSSAVANPAIAALGTTILACTKLQKLFLGFKAISNDASAAYLSELLQVMTRLTATIAAPQLLVISIENPLPVPQLKQFFANPALVAAAQDIYYQALAEKDLELLKIILATAPQLQEISAPEFITAIINSTLSYKLIITAARERLLSTDPVLYFNSKHPKTYGELVSLLNQAKQYQLNEFAALLGLLELLLVDSTTKQQLERIDIANPSTRHMLFARTIMADHTIKLTSSFDLPGLLHKECAQSTVARNQDINDFIIAADEYQWGAIYCRPTTLALLVVLVLLLIIFIYSPLCQIILIASIILLPFVAGLLGLHWDYSAFIKQQPASDISQHYIKIKNKLLLRGVLYLIAHSLISTIDLLLPLLILRLLPAALTIILLPQVAPLILIIWYILTMAAHLYLIRHAASNYNSWGEMIATSIESETALLATKPLAAIIAELAAFLAAEPAAPAPAKVIESIRAF